MKEFGLQLWSIRDYFTTEENTRESFKKMSEMGYTSAQTAGTYPYISPEKFAEYAKEYGIELFSTHYDFGKMKTDVEGTVKYHKTIGAKYIGIGGMGGKVMSKDELFKFIDEINELARIYSEYGLKFTYHNHAVEFCKVDGKTMYDYMIERFDKDNVSFCLDTYWAQYGGVDVARLIERLAGRVDIIHLKDMEPWVSFELNDGKILHAPRYVEVGSGNLDFAHIIKVAEAAGTKYFIVEDEYYSTGNSMESIKISADYIKANLLEK